ncbi:MAG: hypothetical protein ABIS06_04510 [Vicinamibacterales bacterium]
MQTHVKVLAVLFIVLSALGVLSAVAILVIFGGAAGIVGASADAGDAAVALPMIGIAGTGIAIFLLALSLPGLIAGVGLLKLRPWARILGIVLCAINLINIPLGTLFGAYGLWVLLNKESEQMFNPTAALTHP